MPRVCPQCAHGQAEGDFCEVCGTRLQLASPPPTQPAYSPPPPGPTPQVSGATYPPPIMPAATVGTPPPRAQYAPGPYLPSGQPPQPGRGFFSRLFDFSFESFITPSIIKVLFIIYIVIVGLVALAMVIAAFMQSTVLGVLTLLIAAPIGAFLYILLGRVSLEMIIILFRIHDNTDQMALAAKRGR